MSLTAHIYKWPADAPRGIVHIVHGMSEHAGRYAHFASALNEQGYTVYASDLRGHGKTAGDIEHVGHLADHDGWEKVVEDIIDLTNEIKVNHPDTPVYLLGHSMGSFVVRTVMLREPKICDGVILSGTIGHPGLKGIVGKRLAWLMAQIRGKKKRTKLLTHLSFGHFNKRIKDQRTEKDWLTRDEVIVDQYINDPYCMQIFTTQFYYDLARGVLEINATKNFRKLDKDTPVLIVSGSMDPAGEYGKGPRQVYQKMQHAGIKHVELHLFSGGRHEILNETNRAEVYQFIFNWLQSH